MPKARQHILSEQPLRQHRVAEGRPVEQEEIDKL